MLEVLKEGILVRLGAVFAKAVMIGYPGQHYSEKHYLERWRKKTMKN